MKKKDRENKEKSNITISKISMFFSGFLMGNVGLIISFLSRFPTFAIVFFRGFFGIMFLSFFVIIRKSFSFLFLKKLFRRYWMWLIVIFLVNPLVIYFYFTNILFYNFSLAAFLLYTSGIFLLIFLIFTKEEEVSRMNILGFLLALTGVAIIMEFWNGKILSFGLFIGLLSGLTLAIMTFAKKKIYNSLITEENDIQKVGDLNIFLAWWGTLSLIIFFFPFGGAKLIDLSLLEFFICILLGFFPTALAFTLYNVGLRNDKGGNIVILSYFEPVIATINTIIFLQEFSFFTIIGGSLILLANIIILRYSD